MNEREYGVVVLWTDRGFGFIRPDIGDRDVFCHIDSCDMPEGEEPRIGDRVNYEIGVDNRRGKQPRPIATMVRFDENQVGDERKPAEKTVAAGMFARRDEPGTENALSEGLRKFIRDQQ